uniref:Arrestin C-terminal-like domain-containing protein n=1 Tax=Acrobeloides nanus TaxID=290746 RepID=A0A914E683_9BILA
MKARAVALHTMGVAHASWICYDSHIATSRAGQHSQRRVRGCQVYLDSKIIVWDGCNSDKSLPAGVNRFPFSFYLPPMCPPSFEGSLGYIRYYCKAKIDRPWKFDKTAMQSFTVIPHFDLNTIPYAANPIIKMDSKNLGVVLFKHGRIAVKISLLKSGYVPGETIVANLEINNTSSKEVERIDMFLTEISKYEGKCTEVGTVLYCHLDHIARALKTRTVTKASQNICVPANQTRQHTMNLPIPPIAPSFNVCPIIQVDYKLEVKISAKGHINNSLCVDFPVLIGTYPIRAPQYTTPMPTNVPPPPEYLTPPQPTAPPTENNGAPPSYADCVFGKGTVTLEDEDSANMKNSGFTPKYVFYNNINQAPPLPDKVPYPSNQAPNQSAPSVPYPSAPGGQNLAYPYPNAPGSTPYPNVPGPGNLPYPNGSGSSGYPHVNAPLPAAIGTGAQAPLQVPYPNQPVQGYGINPTNQFPNASGTNTTYRTYPTAASQQNAPYISNPQNDAYQSQGQIPAPNAPPPYDDITTLKPSTHL